jgi:glutathione peroxidase
MLPAAQAEDRRPKTEDRRPKTEDHRRLPVRSRFSLRERPARLAAPATSSERRSSMNVYDFSAKTIEGKDAKLDSYKGKWMLVVNVASKCGLTPQYAGLESLYEKYKDKNFTMLGFPCDQFGNQEPGTEAEIQQFCSLNYGVTFPLFSKIEVNGEQAHPLYKYMRKEQPGLVSEEAIKGNRLFEHLAKSNPASLKGDVVRWNFTKFLVDPTGKVVKRYEPDVTPDLIDRDVAKFVS